jgi:hypothetical protein
VPQSTSNCAIYECSACSRLVGLHDVKNFDALLGKTGAKKGAMKSAAAASRAGTIRTVAAKHLGDGQPLTLQMQVCEACRHPSQMRVISCNASRASITSPPSHVVSQP